MDKLSGSTGVDLVCWLYGMRLFGIVVGVFGMGHSNLSRQLSLWLYPVALLEYMINRSENH